MKALIVFNTILISAMTLFAQEATEEKASAFQMDSFLPIMIIMFVVMYFFMIKPEQKKAKDKKSLMDELKKNDKIVTIGGIHGTVTIVKDDTVQVKIADNTVIRISKSAIASVNPNKKESDTKETEDK